MADPPLAPVSWEYRNPLRRWQVEAFAAWRDRQQGIVRVVTGAGKTAFAEVCIAHFARSAPSPCVVIVVPTQVLLDQWYVSLREDLGVDPSEIATFSGQGHSSSPNAINILVLNTSRLWPYRDRLASTALLIVDEAHRAGSPENQSILAADWKATLGLSATPEREYDAGFEQALEPALGPVIYSYSYAEALADAVIVPFAINNVRIPLLEHERREYDKLSTRIARVLRSESSEEAKETLAAQLLQRRSRVAARAGFRVPVSVALAEREASGRTIIFHEFIESAEKIASALHSRGARVTTYHSKLPDSLRRDNLMLFRRGLFDILVTCRALDEGANVPEAATAIIASSTRSARQRIQRLGRILRPARDKAAATVFTLFATRAEREQLEREEETLEGITHVTWREASFQ